MKRLVRYPSVMGLRSPAAELADAHRALLQTMHFDLLVQEVERRGWRVCMNTVCGLPGVYPPVEGDLTEADLPFDGDDRR